MVKSQDNADGGCGLNQRRGRMVTELSQTQDIVDDRQGKWWSRDEQRRAK